MNARDRLWLSSRHIRGRLVESILVILATAVGVALVAAMTAFIRSYNVQTDYLLSHPAYRELVVEVVGNETELTEPVVAFDPTTVQEIRLDVEDLRLAKESVPAISYGYIAEREMLSTRFAPGRGGAAAAFGGAGGQIVITREGDGAVIPFAGDGQPPPDAALEGAPGGAAAAGPGGLVGAVRQAARRGGMGQADAEGRGFDLEQFFQTDPDVMTELPVESFPGIRTTTDFFDAYGLRAASGSLFADEDLAQANQVLVLGSELARTLFPDDDAVGKRVRLNLQTYTVLGVLQPTSLTDVESGTSLNRYAFTASADAQVSFGGNQIRVARPTRTLRFAVADSGGLEVAARQLGLHFDALYGEGAIRVTAPIEALRDEREKLSRLLTVVLFLSAAGLFIASINLFNLMLMRVIKRTKAIGINRAVGASRREVFRQFLNESALMSGVGATIGLLASPVVFNLLRRSLVADVGVVVVNWPYLVIGALAALVVSVLFGVYPAGQAGRVDAAIAIRTE